MTDAASASAAKRVKIQLFSRGQRRDGHLIALKREKKVKDVLKDLR